MLSKMIERRYIQMPTVTLFCWVIGHIVFYFSNFVILQNEHLLIL